LVASKGSEASNAALAKMVGLRLDGSLGEDFSCYALSKGKSFSKFLTRISAVKLAAECNSEVKEVAARIGKSLEGIDLSRVCADKAQIETKAAELVAAIQSGSRCKSTDF
jgi:hypothetical protein